MIEPVKAPPAARESWVPMFVQSINRAIQSATLSNLPTYADDTAAGTGGLQSGQFYKTAAGAVMVKL